MSDEKENQTTEILKKFKEMNPWQGDVGERISKFNWCFKQLKKIYNKKEYSLICAVPTQIRFWHESGYSHVDKLTKTIVLQGRLSVITFLHEFAHILDMDEEDARQWSINLFKKVWPEKYEKLIELNNMMVKKENGGGNSGK